MKKNYFAFGTFIVLAAITLSCNKSADMNPSTPAIGFATDSISMTGTMFSPKVDTVHVGHTIKWQNNDGFAHTATSDDAGSTFSSGNVPSGTSTTFTPTTAGTITYHCAYHQSMGMVGTLIVKP